MHTAELVGISQKGSRHE